MLVLDIRTLSYTTMLYSLIFFVGLLRFAYYNRRFFSLRIFAYGDLILFGGFLLIGMRTIIPDALSIVAANGLIALAFVFFSIGSASFLRIYFSRLWLHVTGLIALSGAFAYFTFFAADTNIRIILINSFLLIESVYISVLFIRDGSNGFSKQKNSMAAGFVLYALFSLFRIIWTLTEAQIGDFLQAGIVHGLIFIMIQILIINSAFSLYWIANSILTDDLESRAKLDPLTKALNRRAFLDELRKEIARSKRESLTFSLIMADIDHFKSVNDNYGHLAGDSVLIAFTNTVTENLRINDVFSRYGGEEFIMLLPNTGKKQAVETAERIRIILEGTRHPFNGQDIGFTVSFGVTSFDMDAQNKEELLENADIALYEAKSKGRNRVESK